MAQQFLVACMQARWSCCKVWSLCMHGGKGDWLGLPVGPKFRDINLEFLSTFRIDFCRHSKPHNSPTRFQVDFQCGCCLHPQPDVAFHFSPRFYTVKPHVICNTLQGGLWQKEVRWPGIALQRGASFLILFLFENEEVKVSGRLCVHQAVWSQHATRLLLSSSSPWHCDKWPCGDGDKTALGLYSNRKCKSLLI